MTHRITKIETIRLKSQATLIRARIHPLDGRGAPSVWPSSNSQSAYFKTLLTSVDLKK